MMEKKTLALLVIALLLTVCIPGCKATNTESESVLITTDSTVDSCTNCNSTVESSENFREIIEIKDFDEFFNQFSTEDIHKECMFNVYLMRVLVKDSTVKWQNVLCVHYSCQEIQYAKCITLYAENEFYDPYRIDNSGIGPYWQPAHTFGHDTVYSSESLYKLALKEAKRIYGPDWSEASLYPYEMYSLYTKNVN